MAKLYAATVYFGTHFDKGNIPDSPARLASFESKSFDSVSLLQDAGIEQVKLDAEFEELRGADYLQLSADGVSTYYVITGPAHMATPHTAILPLLEDPLASAGGIGALTVVAGWAERAHVTDDTLFSNTLPEPWSPSQSLEIHDYKVFHTDSDEGNVEIAIATCDISRGAEYKAKIWHASQSVDGEDVTGDVIAPEAPMPGFGGTQPVPTEGFKTTLEITAVRDGQTETHSYTLPGLFAFDLTNDTVRLGINAIRNIGIDSNIQAMYVIPKQDVTTTPAPDVIYPGGEAKTVGMISKISGNSAQYATGMPYKYADVKNNKVFSLFNSYTITSITSGDSNTFDAKDLYAGGSAPDLVVQTDPSPTGTVYCSPTYFEGKKTHRLEQAVAGLPWLNASFTYTQGSGGGIGMMNARRKNQSVDYNRDIAKDQNSLAQVNNAVNTVGSIANRVTGFLSADASAGITGYQAKAVSTMVGIGTDIAGGITRGDGLYLDRKLTDYNANMQMGDNLFSASVAQNVAAPEMAFPISVNAAAYYGNGFAVSHNTMRAPDVQRLDDFLSAYGYARDTKFIASMLSSRANHNYIKTSGAMVTAPGQPRWRLDAIGRMFDSGVRIWHVVPSQASLTDNPVRS